MLAGIGRVAVDESEVEGCGQYDDEAEDDFLEVHAGTRSWRAWLPYATRDPAGHPGTTRRRDQRGVCQPLGDEGWCRGGRRPARRLHPAPCSLRVRDPREFAPGIQQHDHDLPAVDDSLHHQAATGLGYVTGLLGTLTCQAGFATSRLVLRNVEPPTIDMEGVVGVGRVVADGGSSPPPPAPAWPDLRGSRRLRSTGRSARRNAPWYAERLCLVVRPARKPTFRRDSGGAARARPDSPTTSAPGAAGRPCSAARRARGASPSSPCRARRRR